MALLDDVKAYFASVGVPAGRYSDTLLAQVIDVELTQQAGKCKLVAGQGPSDLTEALCRRVQVNLAKRGLPLGVVEQSSDTAGPSFVPRVDAEVRRLEAPYRKLVVG